MILVAGYMLAVVALLALIVTEPGRADRRQQAVADEDADARLYWQGMRA